MVAGALTLLLSLGTTAFSVTTAAASTAKDAKCTGTPISSTNSGTGKTSKVCVHMTAGQTVASYDDAEEIAAAIARDAEGIADTNMNSAGVIPSANHYVDAAAKESGSATAKSVGPGKWTITWTEYRVHTPACLLIPTLSEANPPFSITPGVCKN
jgi:hypothetical protein